MLTDLIEDLLKADTKEKLEKAFRNLEKVGVDRISAKIMAIELLKERNSEASR